MAALPQPQNTTVVKIYKHWEEANAKNEPRPHLGASIIGKECTRALWYDFRWVTRPVFEGRILRLFDSGNREEFRLTVDLRNAGVTVTDKNPATGKQWQFKDHGGHFSGSMDAHIQGLVEAPKTHHVGEFKTHNLKSFTELQKKGVVVAKPLHYHQMNTYEGWTGMDRAAYFAVCKDNDQIWMERLEFNKADFERDRAKALTVITAPQPLSRISEDPAWFACKFCDHHPVCHVGKVPEVSCRTCVHSTPVIEAGNDTAPWQCEKYNHRLTEQEQRTACRDHLFIPSLLAFAEVQEASEGHIEYRNKRNGKTFSNSIDGAGPAAIGFLTSRELQAMDVMMIGEPIIDTYKAEFPGTTVTGGAQHEQVQRSEG